MQVCECVPVHAGVLVYAENTSYVSKKVDGVLDERILPLWGLIYQRQRKVSLFEENSNYRNNASFLTSVWRWFSESQNSEELNTFTDEVSRPGSASGPLLKQKSQDLK